jgi:hypothetical protein
LGLIPVYNSKMWVFTPIIFTCLIGVAEIAARPRVGAAKASPPKEKETKDEGDADSVGWSLSNATIPAAPNDISAIWVDYMMQIETLGYMSAAKVLAGDADEGDEEGEDGMNEEEEEREAPNKGERLRKKGKEKKAQTKQKGNAELEKAAKAMIEPIKEMQAALDSESVSPMSMKKTLTALLELLIADESFEGDGSSYVTEQEMEEKGMSVQGGISAEALAGVVTSRNRLIETAAQSPEGKDAEVKAAYISLMKSYQGLIKDSVRSAFRRSLPQKADGGAGMDWDAFVQDYVSLIQGPVSKAPNKAGPAVRAYLAAWLRTGAPSKSLRDAAMKGRVSGEGEESGRMRAPVSVRRPKEKDGKRREKGLSEKKAEEEDKSSSGGSLLSMCRQAALAACSCNGELRSGVSMMAALTVLILGGSVMALQLI